MKLEKYQQEIYPILKERNIKNFEKQGKAYATLKRAMEDILPIIKKWDGKIVNKRLITAISNAIPLSPDYILKFEYDCNNKPHIRINVKDKTYYAGNCWHDINLSQFDVDLSCDTSKKLNMEETLKEFEKCIAYTQARADYYQDAIDNYEEYFKRFQAINDVIDSNSIPMCLMKPIYIDNEFI